MQPAETISTEPIAIIGIGCRLPGGVNNPTEFWRLLRDGRDVVGEVPASRWKDPDLFHPDPEHPGTICTRRGAFLEHVDLFDAAFFGISPREASRLDPQQRLLLEIAWEALEDAGQVVDQLAGTRTGVFVGMGIDDYLDLQLQDRPAINAYTNSGAALCLSANRISYAFDFHGPSMTVDTACSSGLVAVHLACQSLWRGESTLALAGSANLLLRPEMSIGFCKASMLSPSGRCWTFDARADGYVRGEGAGLVVLKPLAQALADKDPIYALIAATAVNQDGHTTGITQPSASAQQQLVDEVYRRAGIAAAQVTYVEAHGTGTLVGDPIECQALGRAFGRGRPADRPLRIGSVKTNLGHLEAASGLAGLIKLALAIRHRELPASLHFEHPNPNIDFMGLGLEVQTRHEPWPEGADPVGGVNAFGFGGTNAHAILIGHAGSSPQLAPAAAARDAYLLPFSARTQPALNALAKSYRVLLDAEPGICLHDLCYTASARRSRHSHRAALAATSREHLTEQLDRFLGGETGAGICTACTHTEAKPRIAWVFSGNGPQWWGMARQLLEGEPVFRQEVEALDVVLEKYTGWCLLGELLAQEGKSRMDRAEFAQPALLGVQLGLAALWRAWGVAPDVVVGHSVGEVAAACTAGILSVDDAARVVAARSRSQEATAGKGRMAAVALSAAEVEPLLSSYEGRVSVAAINSPQAVTLTGDGAALEEVVQSLERQGVYCRRLRLPYGFHSSLLDPAKAELLESLAHLAPRVANVRWVSTVTGADTQGPECGPDYWWANARQPVLFAAAIDRLVQEGFTLFLEVGPHPVLAGYIGECARAAGRAAIVAPSLRRKENDRATLLSAVGTLYAAGFPVDWSRLYPDGGTVVKLPAYPWERVRHWNEPEDRTLLRPGQVHPLLGRRVEVPDPLWQGELDRRVLAYLDDHCLQGAAVFPATGYLELALAAGARLPGEPALGVDDLELHEALVVPDGQVPRVQVHVASDLSFTVSSRLPSAGTEWKTHATGRLVQVRSGRRPTPVALTEIRRRCPVEGDRDEHYRRIDSWGLHYGPAFQGMERVWVGETEAFGQVTAPEAVARDLTGYFTHPALLDACIQVPALVIQCRSGSEPLLYIPVSVRKFRFYERPGQRIYTHVHHVRQRASCLTADFSVFDETGKVIATLDGLRLQGVAFGDARSGPEYLYELDWQPQPLMESGPSVRDASCLPGPRQLAETLQPLAAEWGAEQEMERYYRDLEPRMHAFGMACAVAAFRRLGWDLRRGEEVTVPALMKQLGLLPRHERLLHRIFEMLQAEGILKHLGEKWQVAACAEAENTEDLFRQLFSDFPAAYGELLLLERCGRRLGEVLRGEIDPLELIFPEKSSTAEHLYDTAPLSRLYNMLIARAVAAVTAQLGETRTLRILEVGGGTGGVTSHVLPLLPAGRVSYTFTDLSPVLLSRAEQRFRSYPFLKYRVLDTEQDPLGQGFAAHSFDLVIAANVVHATQDVARTLGNLRPLLASEGLLLLLELSRTLRWLEMVFGLLKGWWLFQDLGRRWHPLLTGDEWLEVLAETGYPETARVADPRLAGEPAGSVLLARGPRVAAPDDVPAEGSLPAGRWILFADDTGLGEELHQRLAARGHQVVRIRPGEKFAATGEDCFTVAPREAADMHTLVQALAADETPLKGVIHCWSLDAVSGSQATLTSLEEAQDLGCLSVIHLVQALVDGLAGSKPRLWLVTCGAQPGPGSYSVPGFAQAPLWGLGRSIRNEHPDLRCASVDVSPPRSGEGRCSWSPLEVRALIDSFFSEDVEEEVLLLDEGRWVHRLVPGSWEGSARPWRVGQAGESYRLEIARPGDLDTLVLRQVPRQGPKPGEVEIEVRAAALNFRDVVYGMEMLSGEALELGFGGGLVLGLECAGRVTAVGEGVEEFRAGDAVMAMGRHCFSPHVTAPVEAVAPKPDGLSWEEAATLPAAFVTAWYALVHLGGIRPGERVLIHAAAGGVGLAALQIVRWAGAEALVTAGTAEKRELLRSLGAAHAFDSRSLSFAEEILEVTGGEGVDIVLNSLGGEALAASLGLLKRLGRFIEIGKRDLVSNRKLGLRPFLKGISFHSADLDQMLSHAPARVQSLFREVAAAVAKGELRPLPHRVFPIGRAVDAFRCMQQSRHIGKLVLSLPDPEVRVLGRQEDGVRFRTDATYLITGGLSGLGLAVAEWMVDHGARHLVLAGRRGADTPEAPAGLEALRAAGAEVRAVRMDVTDPDQVRAVLADIGQSLPPLRGVFHGAMVLDDAIVLQQNRDRLFKALRPKMHGAWNLHELTRGLALDHFVLFSSFATLLGEPGQGNYAAAGAFLDALAHYRRGQGLPAQVINWGVLAGAGYVARRAGLAERFERRGAFALEMTRALETFGRLLVTDQTQAGIISMDWHQWVRGANSIPCLLSGLAATGIDPAPEEGVSAGLPRDWSTLLPAERRQVIQARLCEHASRVLGLAASQVEIDLPMTHLGLDSLMAVELRLRIERDFGVDVPVMSLLQGVSVAELTIQVAGRLDQKPAPDTIAGSPLDRTGRAAA